MEPLVYEDLVDREKSIYWADSIPPLSEVGPHEIYKFVYRPDAALTYDLFYDKFFATFVFCSDQLAERLLKAGCTGMAFTDPREYRCADVPRRRTLHGIEVYGEKADPEDYRPTAPIIDGDDESVEPYLLGVLDRDTDKMDWIISRLKE